MTTAPSLDAAADSDAQPLRTVVSRVVFPENADSDLFSLYVDFAADVTPMVTTEHTDPSRPLPGVATPMVDHSAEFPTTRQQIEVPAGRRISLATYFNAFPASYWRRWTTVSSVRLTVRLDGDGQVLVYRSNARGNSQRVDSAQGSGTHTFDLTLKPFGDGGWYWFDLVSGQESIRLESADWSVEGEGNHCGGGTFSASITTFNRPDYCVAQLKAFADALDDLPMLDKVMIVDQGNKKVRDEDGFQEQSARLGDKLQLIDQGNLGGSGGFARGMHEATVGGQSDYVILLDDDVVVETEGLRRAALFADFCHRPTIVGGHMFNMFERSVLHSYGERVNRYQFWWGQVKGAPVSHDFRRLPLRATSELHRRIDVDYNGWWMCLIPTTVIREIGYSLPVFIKWDDAEYGLRAQDHGYPTVSFPGAAVWHVPWIDKDDALDWQAYYHQRNRWLVALLHSPYSRGGSLPKLSMASDVKHLLCMQYSAVELRLQALEDILAGPDALHDQLGAKLGHIRGIRAGFADARLATEPDAFPPTKMRRLPKRGETPAAPRSRLAGLARAGMGVLTQFRDVHDTSRNNPETTVPAAEAKWWRLSQVDSAVVSSADGTGASWYQREPKEFRDKLARSIALHRKLVSNWDRLAEQYQQALGDMTSPQAWTETFDRSTPDT